jgi:hypothetical protein
MVALLLPWLRGQIVGGLGCEIAVGQEVWGQWEGSEGASFPSAHGPVPDGQKVVPSVTASVVWRV